jgi:predicted permease
MRVVQILRLRLRSLFRRRKVEDDLDEELRYHLEREIDEAVAAGASREEARLAALRSIGGLEQSKEECRDMRGLKPLDTFINDVRFAVRQLRKNLEFTSTAVLRLSLGLCSSLAIFAFVDAALIKPLPYRDPARLVGVYERVDPQCIRCNLSWLDYLDWKKENTSFAAFDVYNASGFALTTPSGPVPVHGARVSDGFFRTLGVSPILGRDFYPGEDQPSAGRTVILSYGAWRTQFAGARDVLGRTVVLNGTPSVVVGVLPKNFHFAMVGPADYWLPFHPESECDLRRSCHSIYGVARLKNGVSVDAARANVVSIAQQLEKLHPDSNRNQGGNVVALGQVIVGDIKPILLVLMAGAILLLLIATVDVAGLVLVRSENRKREMAVRTALGASSGRLWSQFLTEALVLVGAGAGLGLAASRSVIELLTRLLSEDMLARMPYLAGLEWNWRLGAFAAGVTVFSAALLAIVPSLRLRSPEIRAGLAEGARGTGGVWRGLGAKLVVVEVATAVVLLVGAGLLGKSFYNLLHVSLGIEPEHLVTIDIAAPNASYGKDPQVIALSHTLLERTASLPGVRSVGLSGEGAPLTHNGNTTWIRVLGRPWDGSHIDIPQRDISPTYFTTLGAKLVSGRYFAETDDQSRPKVAIVNRAFVRKYFPGEEAVGKQIGRAEAAPKPIEIVGVIEDVREGPLDVAIPPVLYRPFQQETDTYFTLAVRTTQDEGSLLPTLSRVVRQIDPEIVTLQGMTMTTRLEQSSSAWLHRSTAWLTGGFAALALLLALVGLYGVITYSVGQRTREIGVRMALGAETGSVYRMILKEAAWLAGLGIIAGLLLGVAASAFLRELLFGVGPWDLETMAAIAAILAVAALVASFVPARRAASVDPVVALRAD